MKKSSDIIGNRTYDLPESSALPHPTKPLRVLFIRQTEISTIGLQTDHPKVFRVCTFSD
jgi:hypothetical protein